MKLKSTLLIAAMIFICSSGLLAQLNIKVGYNMSYQDLNRTHEALTLANMANESIDQKYRDIHFMNGLELGLHYQLTSFFALEASWINGSTRKSTLAGRVNGTNIENQVRVTMSEYSIAGELMFGVMGVGTSYGLRSYKHKGKIDATRFVNLSEDTALSSRFYAIIKLKSTKSAFAIKPYYQFPYQYTNISNFNTRVNGTKPVALEDPYSFGISFVFYNGPQS